MARQLAALQINIALLLVPTVSCTSLICNSVARLPSVGRIVAYSTSSPSCLHRDEKQNFLPTSALIFYSFSTVKQESADGVRCFPSKIWSTVNGVDGWIHFRAWKSFPFTRSKQAGAFRTMVRVSNFPSTKHYLSSPGQRCHRAKAGKKKGRIECERVSERQTDRPKVRKDCIRTNAKYAVTKIDSIAPWLWATKYRYRIPLQ